MAVYNKYPAAVSALLNGVATSTDTWKIALSNSINPADTVFVVGTTDLPTANGYTAGGNTCATVSATQVNGEFTLKLANPATWYANLAGFTFRYAILWNVNNQLPVAYWDYGTSQQVGSNETVQVVLDSQNGVFKVS